MRALVAILCVVLGGCVGATSETGSDDLTEQQYSPMVDVCELPHSSADCDSEGVHCPTECDGETPCTVDAPPNAVSAAQTGECRPVCKGPHWCRED